MHRWPLLLLTVVTFAAPPRAQGDDAFAPAADVFERKCVNCHQTGEKKGGLSLETKAAALGGGETGAAIVPGKPDESLLLDYVSGENPEMPKRGEKLTPAEIAALRTWIAAGAPWPEERQLEDKYLASADWWSLRPLRRPALPELTAEDAAWARNPLDRFVVARLRAEGLGPSAEADRRTLIRRLSFDLAGLPPTPEEVAAFLADDDPRAYDKLVDRLLDSPSYGERWARHWLDVVHYGDTHGYDKDKIRPHAYPYRDYVIRALNEDKPYTRFVEEQLAGDALYPFTRDGIEALGFLAAGPWDYVGHAELPEGKLDGDIARLLDRDDMVSTAMNVFVSATAQCARCHNHKFDPITTEHYYGLQSVFAAIDRADRPYDADPATAARRGELTRDIAEHEAAHAEAERAVRTAAGPRLAAIDARLAELARSSAGAPRPEFGYHSAIEPRAEVVKWVQVELKAATELAQVMLVGCHDDFNGIGAGFGFPLRYKIEGASDADFTRDVATIADRTAADVPNPGIAPQRFDAQGIKAKYIRVTATRLAPRMNDYIFALAELIALTADGENVALGGAVTAADTIEAPVRWGKKNLTDGIFRGSSDVEGQAEQLRLQTERDALLKRSLSPELAQRRAAAESALAAAREALAALPPQQKIYCGTVHTGSGAFRGTGPSGKPREIHVLARGDVRSRVKPATPGAPPFLPDRPWAFALPHDHPEQARRAALAKWIVDPAHPLTWRSIVNRVWLYHFGRGIVDSPNDFGRMGELPTHPELLDWLAVEFRDGRQSLKDLHRLIVTSATYRQSSTGNDAAERIDAGNQFYWRQNRRRLEAEAIHDATLAVAGKLDRTMYGPGFRPFGFRDDHSPEYKYHEHDPDDPRALRRSIYRFIVRSVPDPLMETLDCADPSSVVAKRNETLTPLQALALLNNKLMVRMSEHFAARAEKLGTTDEERVAAAFQLALARAPDAAEQATLAALARRHGLASACRVIFNSNEFVFVD
jgi:mono/diheme cytochrome c family protein